MMKTIKILYTVIALVFVTSSCQDQLDVKNPNEPTPEALNTESGIYQAATGVYANLYFENNSAAGNFDFIWVSQALHEAMGDAMYIPWGNFGWRWANQVSSITLDDGTLVSPPNEGDQALALKARNTRGQTSDNAFAHEWVSCYFVNNTGNVLLSKLEEEIDFTGEAEIKKNTLRAWAHFWKGWAYMRIGSMYISGLIIDTPGETNSDFKSNSEIIAESNRNFEAAIQILNSLTDNGSYASVLTSVIPRHLAVNSEYPTPEEWIRNIRTLQARNALVSIKDSDKTASDWNNILDLANQGIQEGDFIFVMKSDGNNFLVTALVPYRLLIGWHFASERLIQDFKTIPDIIPDAGDTSTYEILDNRMERNFEVLDVPEVNRSGRGIQYGTRWRFVEGDYASLETGKANVYLGGSYEENLLMQAEALINTISIDNGLDLVDEVRAFQNSGLDDVANTGLTVDEAKEELRRERRIGLLMRGLAFYDARRWGVIDPVSEGGGRSPVLVLDAVGNVNTNAQFDYKYMDYFDVPLTELDFNTPSDDSPPVIEQPK
jgi:hypothetical protein